MDEKEKELREVSDAKEEGFVPPVESDVQLGMELLSVKGKSTFNRHIETVVMDNKIVGHNVIEVPTVYDEPLTEDITLGNLDLDVELKVARGLLNLIFDVRSFATRNGKDLSGFHNYLVNVFNGIVISSRGKKFAAAQLAKTNIAISEAQTQWSGKIAEEGKKGLWDRMPKPKMF